MIHFCLFIENRFWDMIIVAVALVGIVNKCWFVQCALTICGSFRPTHGGTKALAMARSFANCLPPNKQRKNYKQHHHQQQQHHHHHYCHMNMNHHFIGGLNDLFVNNFVLLLFLEKKFTLLLRQRTNIGIWFQSLMLLVFCSSIKTKILSQTNKNQNLQLIIFYSFVGWLRKGKRIFVNVVAVQQLV